MRPILIYITLLFLPLLSFADFNVKTYYVDEPSGYQVLVDNNEACPISIQIKFELKNLTSSIGKEALVVVPAKTKAFKIGNLEIRTKTKSYSFNYSVRMNYGDHTLRTYDTDFEYYLPFEQNQEFLIGQGYNGTFSHSGEFSLDFDMPVGTAVHAARSGIVVELVQNNQKACLDSHCAEYNNFVLIYHNDGTFAEYSHLQHNGVLVEEGDQIEIGQKIALSGNTGWSSGPHLHFMVFVADMNSRTTFPTLFKINEGLQKVELVEKRAYKRNY